MKKDIRAYTYEQLAAEMEQIGEKKFRAKQIYEWLHVKLADSFEEMTNLSKALREKLEAEYEILPVKMLERQISKIDATNKFLFQLSDGNVVESVLMRYKHGNSVCISSQVCYITERRKLVGIVSAKDLMTTDDNVPIKDLVMFLNSGYDLFYFASDLNL